MTDYTNYNDFVKDFDIIQNALEMKYLLRWNGRRVGKETLSEHTHLVVACAISLMDEVFKGKTPYDDVNKYQVVKACMIHDSLEILRGDILSITKRAHEIIGSIITEEEVKFYKSQGVILNPTEEAIVQVADLLAVCVFIKNEMEEGNCSELIRTIYLDAYKRCREKLKYLANLYSCKLEETGFIEPKFIKGYEQDAGTDITLAQDVTFLPMSTSTVDLFVKVTPKEGELAYLCARTSAASKGLCVAMCPIDPNYSGHVLAIVHNVSNNIIEYKAGESFCQVVSMPFTQLVKPDKIKKEGTRTDSNRGGTDK